MGGNDITNLRADEFVRLGVGFVPQNDNVFPSLTIKENLEMGAFQAKSFVQEGAREGGRALSRADGPQGQRAGSLREGNARWSRWLARS